MRRRLREKGGKESAGRARRQSKLDPLRGYLEKRVDGGLTSAPAINFFSDGDILSRPANWTDRYLLLADLPIYQRENQRFGLLRGLKPSH